MDDVIALIYDAVLNGHHKEIPIKVKAALKQSITPSTILSTGLIAPMQEVGQLFEEGEYYVPEMLVAARAMQVGMNVLKPYLTDKEAHPAGKVAIGTVEGDFHDIGKNLVKLMLEGAGFEVVDLGVDVRPDRFISAVTDQAVKLLAMSALITTTMPNMIPVLKALEAAGLRSKVKVMVGGAPLTEDFAQQIGADGYAPDASRAVTLAKRLLVKP